MAQRKEHLVITLVLGLASVLALSVVQYVVRSNSQKRNVDRLVSLGGFTYWGGLPTNNAAIDGSQVDKIQVWYDDQVGWDDEQQCYELTYALGGAQKSKLKRMIARRLGKDFAYSPVVLEIYYDYPSKAHFSILTNLEPFTELTPEMIDLIQSLPTIRQIYVRGGPRKDSANEQLKRIFPDLIVADAQQ